ncbi:Pentatricopeptide repeat-containing protein, partial [Cynara cardunculus var. scolymus]
MPDRDVFLWNAVINCYAQIGEFHNALECLQRLRVEGNVPSRFTMTGILSVLTLKGNLHNEKAVHGLVIGYFSGVAVCNALIDMYEKCKSFLDALDIFELMPIKDIYSWNSITGVHQQYVFRPNIVTVTTVLLACSHLAALRHGKEIHGYMITKGLGKDGDDTYINNVVMDMCDKCGSMRKAQLVFDHMTIKDSASWNIMIMGYAMHRFGHEALNKAEFKNVQEWKGLVEKKQVLAERLLAQYVHDNELSRGQSGDVKM